MHKAIPMLAALTMFAPGFSPAAGVEGFGGGQQVWPPPGQDTKTLRLPDFNLGIRNQPSAPSAVDPAPIDDLERLEEMRRQRERMLQEERLRQQRRMLERQKMDRERRMRDIERLHRQPDPDIGIRKEPARRVDEP